MIYKLNIEQLHQVHTMNVEFVENYKKANPSNKISTYANADEIRGHYYILKDTVTEQYITDYVEIVSELPEKETWHSKHQDKQFQIILTEKQAVQLILVKPEFGFLNQSTITENSYVYIYVNYIEDEDMILLESQNIIINQNKN